MALSSVTNALRVLKAFSSTKREWGVSDLARHLDIGKSTVHRLLSTLVEERMLEQDAETSRYRLGLAMFDLAAAVPTQLDLHEAVLSPMTELRNRSGETVQVAVLDGRQVVYVERLDSPHTLRMFLEIGRRNHAHSTGTGKALLAYLPRHDLDRLLKRWDLPRLTPHTITDHASPARRPRCHPRPRLRREPARVRGRGGEPRCPDPRRQRPGDRGLEPGRDRPTGSIPIACRSPTPRWRPPPSPPAAWGTGERPDVADAPAPA